MSQTKYVNAEWVCEKPGRYVHSWESYPYQAKTSVRWRGLEFHIRIQEESIDCGRKKTFDILFKGKLYQHGAAKWKWTGGSFGALPQNIISGNYRLEFDNRVPGLAFDEVKINPLKRDENTIDGKIEFFETPDHIQFDRPQPKKPSCKSMRTDEIELYNYRDAYVASDVVASFDKDRLVLNTWRLGASDDEYYYIVSEEPLRKLFKQFKLEEHQKAELLIGLYNAFGGKDCIKNFTEYLDYHKIKYSPQFCLSMSGPSK